MDDRGAVLLRQGRREPFDQPLDFGNVVGLRHAVLLGPAADLTREVVARRAVIAEADCNRVDRMELRQGVDHRAVDRAALLGRAVGQGAVPEGAAFDQLHQIERRADHLRVLA